MRGSEKQIKWAEEIRARIVKTLEAGIEMQKKVAPENVSNINGYTALLTIVKGFDGYAGEMIDAFKSVEFNGDIYHDMQKLVSAIRPSKFFTPTGELQKQISALFYGQ